MVIPFGLTNAPTTYQSLMNDTLDEGLGKFVVVYLDDILIFLKIKEEHVKHVRWVIKKLRERHLRIKLEKYKFFKHEVPFLGSIVRNYRVRPDPVKIKSVVE